MIVNFMTSRWPFCKRVPNLVACVAGAKRGGGGGGRKGKGKGAPALRAYVFA